MPSTFIPSSSLHPNFRNEFFISLMLAILTTIFLEHSPLDIWVSQHFYLGNGDWIIKKGSHLPDLIFYTGIKHLLIAFEVYVIAAWLLCLLQQKKPNHKLTKNFAIFRPLQRFSILELGYLAGVMLLVPTIVDLLKYITGVPCPNDIQLFGGKWEFLPLWQDIIGHSGQKCFPAAHASSGFALYALCFVPSLKLYRWQIAIAVTVLAWLMGGYKMMIGDHFLSHTVVSMFLGWAICAGMAWLFTKFFSRFHRF